MHEPSLSDRIRDFALLSEEERARVIEEAAAYPELDAELKDAMAFADVVDATMGPDTTLAGLADVRLGHRAVPPLAPEDEVAEVNARLDALEAEIEPPLKQFERLTGRTLGPLAPEASVHTNGVNTNGVGTNGHEANGRAHPFVADRAPVARQRPLARRLVFACLGLAVLYGGLFGVSAVQTPERVRVADISDVSESFRAVRGQQVDRFAEAVGLLADARRSTFGLFPQYDDTTLDQAVDMFAEIARESPQGQYGQESALAIGRIRLLQGREDEARIALESVVAHTGYRAPEAARLLDYLDAQNAAP